MILSASPLDAVLKATQAMAVAQQAAKEAATNVAPTAAVAPASAAAIMPPPPSALTPAQQSQHDALVEAWRTETDPAKKAVARAALVAYDGSLPPPPPPLPPQRTSPTVDFFVAHQTSLLIGAGVLAAAGIGYAIYKRRKR